MIRLPPHVRAALAKRRGTAAQRKLAMEAQAPHVPVGPPVVITPEKIQKARDLVCDRDEQTLAARRRRFANAISKPRNSEP